MKKILGRRGCGKTTELIKLSNETGGYIVCRNEMVRTITNMAMDMKMHIPFPLTYREFIEKQYYAKGVKCFYIDDVDSLMEYISNGVQVEAITITYDVE